MKKKTFFKMVVISSVLLITGGILIACGKTKEEKKKELLSEYIELSNEEPTKDPKEVLSEAYNNSFLKTDRNGWNDNTNKRYTFGDYEIILPDYFIPRSDEPEKNNDNLLWKFNNDDHSLLTLSEGYYQKTEITSNILETIYNDQKNSFKEFEGPKPLYSEYNDETDLIYYTASVILNDNTKARNTTAIYVLEDRTLIINLLSKQDAQFDYSNDFNNIMTHVNKTSE